MTSSQQDLLVVSSRNPHKLAELRQLLAALPIEVVSAAECGVPEVAETGATFEDNALLKAAAAFTRTGAMALADDSGLVVDALRGAPGVLSARFAGERATDEDNNALLLRELADVPDGQRTAAFVCSLVLLVPEDRAVPARPGCDWRSPSRRDLPPGAAMATIEGRCGGFILRAPRGQGGFGYDPLFLYPPADQTFAELAQAEKNRISHRARAFQGLRTCLEAIVAR